MRMLVHFGMVTRLMDSDGCIGPKKSPRKTCDSVKWLTGDQTARYLRRISAVIMVLARCARVD